MRKLMAILVMVFAVAVVPVGMVSAVDLNPDACSGANSDKTGCPDENEAGLEERLPGVINAILWIAGALAVGMIIYAAVKMIISQGDTAKVEQEKKTITYSVVGLIVVLLAWAIVGFISGQFGSIGGGDESSESSEEEYGNG